MQQYGMATGLTAQLEGPFGSTGAQAKLVQVTLPAQEWKNAESPYFQTVEIEGISVSSMVQLQAEAAQIAKLCAEGTALCMENEGGVVTAYAIGTKPEEDMTLQAVLTEVVRT